MKITVYGAGPIGLTTSIGLCQFGHEVLCIDIDQEKVIRLQENDLPFYEPGLNSLLEKFLKNKMLKFSSKPQHGLENSVHFIAIGTPNKDGIPQIGPIEQLTRHIFENSHNSIIFIKSTVPPGTSERLKKLSNANAQIISHPEFLREGTALADFLNPERLVFGGENLDLNYLTSIYTNIAKDKFLLMSHSEAELSKYLANAYLAQRVSFINQAALLCENFSADIVSVKKVLASDTRIGEQFLNAGLGFGGSCFPKDLVALNHFSRTHGVNLHLVQSTIKANHEQIQQFAKKIESYFLSKKLQKKISIWGLSFKPNTDDLRESPSLKLINELLALKYQIQVHDPVAKEAFLNLYADQRNITLHDNPINALQDSNALILATAWENYKEIPLAFMLKKLSHPALFDGRNFFNKEEALKLGFHYVGVGR